MSWADAWSSRNVSNYLEHYSETFKPVGGASRTAWAKYRSSRLQAPSFIVVNVSDLKVEPLQNGNVRARFVQDYQSDGYQDSVNKSLLLVSTPGGWKIQSEQSRPK
jgi:adhesin transport system outer membrane protein